MTFHDFKKNALEKADKSKKGSWDMRIIPLCDVINSHPDYYTTSSCSGRIVLFLSKGEKKNQHEWLFVTHDLADEQHVVTTLLSYREQHPIVFKQQSAILHVGCRSVSHAQRLVELGMHTGFKRSGIIASEHKIIVEMLCTEHLDAPIFDQVLLVSEEYVRYLVRLGNKKMEKSWNAISRLARGFETLTASTVQEQ